MRRLYVRPAPAEVRRTAAMTVLTVIAGAVGAVDAVSFLTLGKVFCARVTGNVLFLSFASAGEGDVPVARAAAAVAAFPAGAAPGAPALAGLAARGCPWSVAGLTGEGLRVLGTSRGRGHDLGCSGDGSERPRANRLPRCASPPSPVRIARPRCAKRLPAARFPPTCRHERAPRRGHRAPPSVRRPSALGVEAGRSPNAPRAPGHGVPRGTSAGYAAAQSAQVPKISTVWATLT
ncbi:DUF1275 family protein [Streptomyces griseoincarnatus]